MNRVPGPSGEANPSASSHRTTAQHTTTQRSDRILEVEDVTVQFGGVKALDGASFTMDRGQICGLIGPNGAGKTTLFNVISRLYPVKSGQVRFDGRDLLTLHRHQIAGVRIARTFQNLGLFRSQTVLENVMTGAQHRSHAGVVRCALSTKLARAEERALRLESIELLHELGLTRVAYKVPQELPYGTMKRIELARALIAKPSLLMLDEPASGLTHGEVRELGDLIRTLPQRFELSVLLVEHHMALVMGISDKVVAFDFGRRIAEGTPHVVQRDPAVVAAYLGTA